jgi:acetyl-CoA carboxylase carboxyltransferase component
MLFAVCQARVPRISVLVRKAYGGGYLAMSGSPTAPDAVLALATAKPALMGPAAAVNAIHYNRIVAIEDEVERAAFIDAKRGEYEANIDVFRVASENSVEEVVPGARLREDLIVRFTAYSRRPALPAERRNGIYPV